MTLMPLSSEIPDEAKNLSTELRRFFDSLGISVRRYAARHNYDPATVSRYLNGKRVPPWPFVQDLLTEVAENFGTPVQQDAYEVIRKLHRLALEVSNKKLYEVQVLQDRLAEADKEHKLAELRERTLLEAMQARQHRIAQLTSETMAINSSLLEERDRSERLEKEIKQLLPAKDELTTLREEVRALKEQLNRAQELSEQAEARCQELEDQLQAAEEAAQSGNEAREQEELQSALQEAAEAKAQADVLRELLEQIQKEATPNSEPNPAKGPKRPRRDFPLRRKTYAEQVKDKPAAAIAAELVKMEISGQSSAAHRAISDIAEKFPIQKIGELIVKTSAMSESTSRTLLMGVGDYRSPAEIIALIRERGTEIVGRGSDLASQLILWFSWDRQAADIFKLVALLRHENWNELATECLAGAAQHQPPERLVHLIKSADPADRRTLLDFTASSRSTEKIVPLVAMMQDPKHVATTSELLTILKKSIRVNSQTSRSCWMRSAP